MNWLAHLLLSEPSSEFRVGSILPDLLPKKALAELSPVFLGGIERHRQIDAFTDRHDIVRRSIERFNAPYRRFGGILTDVFYDHFLAREWDTYSSTQLPEFAAEVYASFKQHRADIPEQAYLRLDQIATGNFLCSYCDLNGITNALMRIDSRFQRPCDLPAAINILERQYNGFRDDFRSFFPELVLHISPAPTAMKNC